MRQLNDRPKSQTAKTSSEQVPYRSLVCKHKSSFAALLLLLPKQEYCYRRCLNQDVVVQGNPRVYKALKTEFATVLAELKRIEAGKGVDDELLSVIELISIILGGLKGEDANGE